MSMPDASKVWALFMSDPPDFILMFVGVIAPVACFIWWFRGHLSKERLAIKDAQVDLARSQRDDLSTKLTEALAKLAEAEGQIAASASPAQITTTVATANNLFKDAKLISDRMGYTLSVAGGRIEVSGTPAVIRLTENSE